MAKREDQPEWDFGASEEESKSAVAGRWIDAPAESDEEITATPKRPEGFDGPSAAQEPEVQTVVEERVSTPAEPRRSSGSLKRVLLIAGALILVAALGFFGFMALNGFQEKQEAVKVQEQVQQEAREKAKAIEEADNPFAVLVGQVDPPSEDPLDVTVAENKISVGDSSLSIREGTLAPTVNGCTLGAITDICLGARGKLGEGDFDVLLVKDISRTRLLDNPSEFKEIKTTTGVSSAVLGIDMGSAEGPDRFGVLTSNGTTGFVLIFPKGTSADRVEEVLKAATVI